MKNCFWNCFWCKHWSQFYDPDALKKDWEAGPHEWVELHGNRWGKCERTQMREGKAEDALSIAVTQDGSDYEAHLETREDFGCVQWEMKSE